MALAGMTKQKMALKINFGKCLLRPRCKKRMEAAKTLAARRKALADVAAKKQSQQAASRADAESWAKEAVRQSAHNPVTAKYEAFARAQRAEKEAAAAVKEQAAKEALERQFKAIFAQKKAEADAVKAEKADEAKKAKPIEAAIGLTQKQLSSNLQQHQPNPAALKYEAYAKKMRAKAAAAKA